MKNGLVIQKWNLNKYLFVVNISTWKKSILQEMSKQWVILGLKLGHRCQILGLVLKPQVLGLGSWILGSKSLVLGPVNSVIITKCDRYYKVWQKIITKCDRYYKVWQKVITKCNRYYKVWQLLQNEAWHTFLFDIFWKFYTLPS